MLPYMLGATLCTTPDILGITKPNNLLQERIVGCDDARHQRSTTGVDRNGPCKSRWLGYFVDREVGAIW